MGPNGHNIVGRDPTDILVVDGTQRTCYCGWDPRAQSGDSKSEQAKHCMDLGHGLHWLHLEPLTHQDTFHSEHAFILGTIAIRIDEFNCEVW
jgi:hypothetical protein